MKIFKNLDIDDLENEIWKVIKDFPDYYVSNFGRIKSFKQNKINGKILKYGYHKSNHLYIIIYNNKSHKTKKIHILVYEIFNNYKLKDNECIHHIDFNPENNYYKNLKLMNQSDHKKLHKKSEETKIKMSKNHSNQKRENNNNSVLSNLDVYDIRKSLELKLYTPKQLSWMFDVSIEAISSIKNKRNWLGE